MFLKETIRAPSVLIRSFSTCLGQSLYNADFVHSQDFSYFRVGQSHVFESSVWEQIKL